jgi:nitric oxide reductase NorQ protein
MAFDFPDVVVETAVISRESGLDPARSGALARLARHIRALSGMDLEEGVSTRLLIYAATLIKAGTSVDAALEVAVVQPLSDDAEVQTALRELIATVYG